MFLITIYTVQGNGKFEKTKVYYATQPNTGSLVTFFFLKIRLFLVALSVIGFGSFKLFL